MLLRTEYYDKNAKNSIELGVVYVDLCLNRIATNEYNIELMNIRLLLMLSYRLSCHKSAKKGLWWQLRANPGTFILFLHADICALARGDKKSCGGFGLEDKSAIWFWLGKSPLFPRFGKRRKVPKLYAHCIGARWLPQMPRLSAKIALRAALA
jgi:hypothetical protein